MLINRPYEVSAIDGKSYCVKNGKFTTHLKQHGLTTEEYCVLYKGMARHLCPYCGLQCAFNNNTETYTSVCKSQKCINKAISAAKQAFTDEQKQQQNIKRQQTMATKYTDEERQEMNRRGKETTRRKGGFAIAVQKRQATCSARHGNKFYNNSSQISSSKLAWTKERKNEYLKKLQAALGGLTLTEYRDKFAPTWKVKRKATKVSRGLEMPSNMISAYQKYRMKVDYLTSRNYKKFKHIINPKNLPRVSAGVGKQRGGYQVDHIVSIKRGFLDNIPPEIIAHVDNLQMLNWRDNIIKGWNK